MMGESKTEQAPEKYFTSEIAEQFNFPLVSSIPQELFNEAFSNQEQLERMIALPENLFRNPKADEICVIMIPILLYNDKKPRFLIKPILPNIPLLSQLEAPVQFDSYGQMVTPVLRMSFEKNGASGFSVPNTNFRKTYWGYECEKEEEEKAEEPKALEKPEEVKEKKVNLSSMYTRNFSKRELDFLSETELEELRYPLFIIIRRGLYDTAVRRHHLKMPYMKLWEELFSPTARRVLPGEKVSVDKNEIVVALYSRLEPEIPGSTRTHKDCIFLAQELLLSKDIYNQISEILREEEDLLEKIIPICNFWEEIEKYNDSIKILDTISRQNFYENKHYV